MTGNFRVSQTSTRRAVSGCLSLDIKPATPASDKTNPSRISDQTNRIQGPARSWHLAMKRPRSASSNGTKAKIGFDWRNGRVVKERVSALETIRWARHEVALPAAWTSRFVRDHEAVEPGSFGLGDREGFLLRYYRESSRLRPSERLGESGSTVDPSQSMRAVVHPIRRRLIQLQLPRTPRRRRAISMSPSAPLLCPPLFSLMSASRPARGFFQTDPPPCRIQGERGGKTAHRAGLR